MSFKGAAKITIARPAIESRRATGIAFAPLTTRLITLLLVPDARRALRSSPAYRFLLGDRKSTRPNSSHLVISYAVFCLKKKKKNPNYIDLVISYAVFCLKKKNTTQ